MEIKLNVTDLTHDDLVTILSSANYSNIFDFFYDKKKWEKIEGKSLVAEPCFEDKLADLLLNGDSIIVYDMYAEGEIVSKTHKGKLIKQEINTWYGGMEIIEIAKYEIYLSDIIDALNNKDCMSHTLDLYNKHDDLTTAETILQFATFGEEVYG